MNEISDTYVYLNGRCIPYNQAMIHITDRGYTYGESFYQTIAVYNRQLIDLPEHLNILQKSATAIGIDNDNGKFLDIQEITLACQQLIERNDVSDGICYIQISPGAHPRALILDQQQKSMLSTTVFINVTKHDFGEFPQKLKPLKVMTMLDPRHNPLHNLRRYKGTNLLSVVCAKQRAVDLGFDDVWFYRDNNIMTEGSANNIWLVDENGVLRTTPDDGHIVPGITRARILQLAQSNGIECVVGEITHDDLYKAREAFISASISLIRPISQINDYILPLDTKVTSKLAQIYYNQAMTIKDTREKVA